MILRCTTLFLLLLGLVLGGCTDPTSIDPAVSDATWTPAIELEFSNYRRVEVNFSNETPLDAERNLSQIEVQYRQAGQADYAPLDTIDLQHANCCVPYESDPVLEEGADYELRMHAHYRKGAPKTSNRIQFTSPVVKGERLDTIAAPLFPVDFQLTKDGIYLIEERGGRLLRIDRATQEETILFETFDPDPVGTYEHVGVHDDTLLATAYLTFQEELLLTTVDLQAQDVVQSKRISPPTDGEDVSGHLIHYDGTNAHVLWKLENLDWKIQVLDARTGEVITDYPLLEEPNLFPDEVVYDGSQYWTTVDEFTEDFENRIAPVDPSNGTVGAIHQIPIYRPQGLAWDGEHFWSYDNEIRDLVKFSVNGI